MRERGSERQTGREGRRETRREVVGDDIQYIEK